VARMKNEHVAGANHGLASEQRVGRVGLDRMWRGENRREVVRKDLGVLVLPILLPARTLVSRAKKTVGIVFGQGYWLRGFDLPIPWVLHAVRVRHQHILPSERIVYKTTRILGCRKRNEESGLHLR
jgi:hypothetical protein